MPTISEQLTQLTSDRDDLVDNLTAKGITGLTGDETFTELVPEVLNIPSGGGSIDDYFDFNSIKFNSYSGRMARALKKVPNFDTTSWTNFSNLFQYCNILSEIPQLNTSSGTNFTSMFEQCNTITSIPQINTSNGTTFNGTFSGCSNLTTIPELDFGKANNIWVMLSSCSNLTNLGGFKDLGKAYTATSAGYMNYTLNLSVSTKLTHDSLMNVINDLYDLNKTYSVHTGGTLYSQTLNLGSTNLAKLTEEEKAIATDKGWTLS